jgi:hypothetical protein
MGDEESEPEAFPIAMPDQYRETLDPYRNCPDNQNGSDPQDLAVGSFDRVV